MTFSPGEPWSPQHDAPRVRSFDPTIAVELFPSGLQSALIRSPKIELQPLDWQPTAPGVVSLPLAARTPQVSSYYFEAPAMEIAPADGGSPNNGTAAVPVPRASDADGPPSLGLPSLDFSSVGPAKTRIAPPDDIVKLEDRLFYVLQPALESLLGGPLSLPFHPFPYQFEGIAFLYPRHAAVLADEMGLGKTMQAITTVRLLLHAGELRRVLLICPKPLVTNWQREFKLWAPEIPLTTVEGDQTRRRWQWNQADAVVTIANYELVNRDERLIAETQRSYDLVMLDESQRIKNAGGTTSQAVCGIRRRRSWALTGTPVENSADDLVGIFEFVSPGLLSPGMRPRRIAQAVSDHVLRRTKDTVLEDLPPKMIRDTELRLTAEQFATYQQAEDEGVIRLSEMGDSISVQHVFQLVLRLKQICNFDPATGESAKLEQLQADLEEIARSGKKAIVFSQWVETLTRLAKRLKRFGPLEYHGRIPSSRRDGVIEQFRNDPKSHVILMSYGAGGVGLNLQFSEYVFLFDRWWNPAVEDQAIARAHRVGAAGAVTVSRYLAVNTIEERINQILEEKRELFDTIFANGNDSPRDMGLSQKEIFGLFNLDLPRRASDRAA